MLISVDEVKEFARIDADDDYVIQLLIEASEEYLKNASGCDFREFDSDNYRLEKLILQMRVAHFYEHRNVADKTGIAEEFDAMVRPLMIQLKAKWLKINQDAEEA